MGVCVGTQELGVRCDVRRGYPVLSIYCPYWMVNKTSYDLVYRVRKPMSFERFVSAVLIAINS